MVQSRIPDVGAGPCNCHAGNANTCLFTWDAGATRNPFSGYFIQQVTRQGHLRNNCKINFSTPRKVRALND